MKKFMSGCLVVMAFFVASTSFAQQKLTMTVKDHHENSVFTINLKGFFDPKEASAFCNKMRALPDVSSVEDLGKDVDGSYKAVIKTAKPKKAKEFLQMAEKAGVTHVEAKRETKTVQEWLADMDSKGTKMHEHLDHK